MKVFLKNYWLLLMIIGLAIVLRFYNLANVPPSASLDEASIGYNAYSLLKTGKDEYGYVLPLLLRSYDDWRPAAYVYLVMPFIALTGLSVLAVRMPSVLLSVITVIATYFLTKEIWKSYKLSQGNERVVASVTTLLLAISPWHIYISRLGHEVNLGLTLVVLGLLFFMRAMNNRSSRYALFVAALLFSFSLYAYQSQKVIIPLLAIGLAVLFWKQLLEKKNQVIVSVIIAIIVTIPIFFVSLSPEALIRLKGTSAFSTTHGRYYEYAVKGLHAKEKGDIIGQVIHNRRFVGLSIFIENYTAHFNPFWLFTNSGNERHKVPNLGVLYLWEFPLILLGVIFTFRASVDRKIKGLLLFWMFISPIPGAITTDAPHVMRTFTFLPLWQLCAGAGFLYVYLLLKKTQAKVILMILFLGCIVSSVYALSYHYFIVFPHTQSDSFQYALGKTIPFVLTQGKNYNKIVFSNDKQLYQSYMFFLFYSKYDPVFYLQQGGTRSGGFAETHTIGKYQFRPLKSIELPGSLVIGNKNEYIHGAVQENITNKKGEEVISIWK